MSRAYNKPDGSYTNDAGQMLDAWAELVNPIADFLDAEVTGFNPRGSFSRGQWSIQLDVNTMMRIKAKIDEAAAYKQALEAIVAISNKSHGPDWEEIEEAREIASKALNKKVSP